MHMPLAVTGQASKDPYYSYVTALLHFDGADNATTTTDEKGNTWTFHDNAKISTPGFYGAGRLNCTPVSGRAWISAPSAVGQFAGDFTIEAKVKTTNTGTYLVLFDKYDGTANGYQIYHNNGYIGLYTNSDQGVAATGQINDGNEHWVAICRNGSTIRAFVDGALVRTWTSLSANFSSTALFGIAGQTSTSGTYAAYADFDEVRLTSYARYTSAYTVPTKAFPNK